MCEVHKPEKHRSQEQPSGGIEFPRYMLLVGSGSKAEVCFLPLEEAGVQYDSGFQQVELGNVVLLDETLAARFMTQEDRDAIRDCADRYSASK